MNKLGLCGVVALAGACLAGAPAGATPAFPQASRAGPPAFNEHDFLADAVAGAQRSAVNSARDGWRHPHESLTFWGVGPGETIVEISPAGGYWTEILAPYAKATGGTYIAALGQDPAASTPEAVALARAKFKARYADPNVWGDVHVANYGLNAAPLAAPGTADVVLTARNIHDWVNNPALLDAILMQAYAALRPGGILAVEDHRADPRPMSPDARDGYVSEGFVMAAAAKAGFRFDARSEINANPKDSKDHPFGVWTLPPVRRSAPAGQPANPAFDHTRYDAIGESDRMTLRFRKPG